ncbi:MAG TPA: DUF1501 domain-containing protein [Pirellulales bacterium]|jgi:hypothetical protein|nr:DUF1501 domain-containing protein [Pirellulales bacterium]
MFTIKSQSTRLCDGISRREILRIGSLGVAGLTLPNLLRHATAQGTAPVGRRAKSCIVLFLFGGPAQHSTWDPKPAAPIEIRGELKPISTTVPGLLISELLPKSARLANHLCLLRAVRTGDNAHSSSGYYMLTGQPHAPMNMENANPGAPNNWPSFGSIVRRLRDVGTSLPSAVRLPHQIFNTDGSVWPGQDAGFIGRAFDPWMFRCQPASPDFRVPEFTLPIDLALTRLEGRRQLLSAMNQHRATVERGEALAPFDAAAQQAFDLLTSPRARAAFQLDDESTAARDRYGRTQFGQSVLLARRLVEAGVTLVQVNWFRSPDEPSDTPCWDSHTREIQRLRTVLLPQFDQAYSALLEDLVDRGMLDETLVICLAEFGRTPRINAAGGRDHWGNVFSVAMAGGGIRGGHVHGASDAIGGEPKEGLVRPPDLLATLYHCLGYAPTTELHDALGRPFPISRGEVVREIVG